MQEIKTRIETMRDDCKMLISRIEEDLGRIEILVIDPLYSDDRRIIQFSRKIWSEDEPKDHPLDPAFMPDSPTYEEVLAKLGKINLLPEVLHMNCKIGNEVLTGGEIQ